MKGFVKLIMCTSIAQDISIIHSNFKNFFEYYSLTNTVPRAPTEGYIKKGMPFGALFGSKSFWDKLLWLWIELFVGMHRINGKSYCATFGYSAIG